jgi:hypothetical protein
MTTLAMRDVGNRPQPPHHRKPMMRLLLRRFPIVLLELVGHGKRT